jgi:hypothetical protein
VCSSMLENLWILHLVSPWLGFITSCGAFSLGVVQRTLLR